MTATFRRVASLAAALLTVPCSVRAADGPAAGAMRMYIGTYTGPKSRGIYVSTLDPATGAIGEPTLAGEATDPSFLAIAPGGKFLYSADESAKPPGSGAVSAFAIQADGKLKHLNDQPLAGGPCYITTDKTGHIVLAAQYGNGTVASFTTGDDGALSPIVTLDAHKGVGSDPKRQEGPHAHCVDMDPANRYALSCDLGLDKVIVYRLDAATGKLTPNDPPFAAVNAGSGPRHLAFHPSGKFVYVINEMASTVTAFSYDAERGALAQIETVLTLPPGYKGDSSCAEIAVHPSGKFLYGSNRGHNSIAVFRINEQTGKLTAAGHAPTGGKNPRGFGIDPSGRWLIAGNQNSDTLVEFKIDPATGALESTDKPIDLASPVCVKFVEAAR